MDIKKEQIYEIEQIILGTKKVFPKYLFKNSKENNEREALLYIKYVIEEILHYTPYEALRYVTMDTLRKFNIETCVKYISMPPIFPNKEDLTYIIWKIYPDDIHLDFESITIEVFDQLLSGKIYKLPKGFFTGTNGRDRLIICFRHFLNKNYPGLTTPEIYKYFTSVAGINDLKKYKMLLAIDSFFDYIPNLIYVTIDDHDLYYYKYYLFKSQKRKIWNEIHGNNGVNYENH